MDIASRVVVSASWRSLVLSRHLYWQALRFIVSSSRFLLPLSKPRLYANVGNVTPNNAINSDVQKRRFALLLHAGYGER